jgi:hypothetical protein
MASLAQETPNRAQPRMPEAAVMQGNLEGIKVPSERALHLGNLGL